MKKLKGTKVSHTTGSEGPKYDPYSYDEWCIERGPSASPAYRNWVRITYHCGLATWIRIETEAGSHEESEPSDRFVQSLIGVYCGCPFRSIQKAWWTMKNRCPVCHGRNFRSASGYPGETFDVCIRCNEVVNTHFNKAAIE